MSNKRPLINLLFEVDDHEKVVICKEENMHKPIVENTKYNIPIYVDPATIGYRIYDYQVGQAYVILTSEKETNIDYITLKYIQLLKMGYKQNLITKQSYYTQIAAYLSMNHIDKPADKIVEKTIDRFKDIPFDEYKYFMCVLINDIFKHGEIHIDIAGNLYWYDIVREQIYDDTGFVKYPPLTIPISEINNKYLDAVKGKKPMTEDIKHYLYWTVVDYAESICKVEDKTYEGGIML